MSLSRFTRYFIFFPLESTPSPLLQTGIRIIVSEMGKKPIVLKKIEDRLARNVAFSKRRKGILSKSIELCALGAQLAIVVFSAGGAKFRTGFSSEFLANYLNNRVPTKDGEEFKRFQALFDHVEETKKRKQAEERRAKQLVKQGNGKRGFWWRNSDLGGLTSVEELHGVKEQLKKLRENVLKKLKELEKSKRASPNEPVPLCIEAPIYDEAPSVIPAIYDEVNEDGDVAIMDEDDPNLGFDYDEFEAMLRDFNPCNVEDILTQDYISPCQDITVHG